MEIYNREDFEKHINSLFDQSILRNNVWPRFARSLDDATTYLDLYINHRWDTWKACEDALFRRSWEQ